MQDPGLFAMLALAFAQVGQGQVAEATSDLRRTREARPGGHVLHGVGSRQIWRSTKGDSRMPSAFWRRAPPRISRRRCPTRPPASSRRSPRFSSCGSRRRRRSAAAEKALANSQAIKIRFLAARVFLSRRERPPGRRRSPTGLAAELQAEPQAYAVNHRRSDRFERRRRPSGDQVVDGSQRSSWIPGSATSIWGGPIWNAGAFPQADSEFDRCLKRRGEALALFLDEEPTYGVLPAGVLLPGAGQGRAEEHEVWRIVRRLPRDSRDSRRKIPSLPEVRRRAAAGEPR